MTGHRLLRRALQLARKALQLAHEVQTAQNTLQCPKWLHTPKMRQTKPREERKDTACHLPLLCGWSVQQYISKCPNNLPRVPEPEPLTEYVCAPDDKLHLAIILNTIQSVWSDDWSQDIYNCAAGSDLICYRPMIQCTAPNIGIVWSATTSKDKLAHAWDGTHNTMFEDGIY